jgi:hypothetical protein
MADEQRSIKELFKQFTQSSKLAQSVQAQAQQTMSAVSTHVREVIPGTIQEIGDFAKKTLTNIGNFFKGLWDDVGSLFGLWGDDESKTEKKAQEEREKQTGWLGKIYQHFVKAEKAKLRDYDDKGPPKSFKDILALGIVGMIGAVIGAFIRTIILPIELFLKLPLVRKIKGIFKPLKGFFTRLLTWADDIPFLGRLLRGVSAGFKLLGWPLTLLLGVIDFVKGFMETEGSLFDKIKGGFTIAIMKFLELPIRALGWILEKLGLEDATAKIASLFKGTIGFIFDLIYSVFSGIYELVKMFPWDAIKTVIGGIADVFLWPFKKLWEWMKDSTIIKWLASKFGGAEIGEGDPFSVKNLTEDVKAEAIKLPQAETPETALADVRDARKKEAEMNLEEQRKLYQGIDGLTGQIKDLQTIMKDGQQSIVSIAQKTVKEPEPGKEPPSNQENLGMVLTNMAF